MLVPTDRDSPCNLFRKVCLVSYSFMHEHAVLFLCLSAGRQVEFDKENSWLKYEIQVLQEKLAKLNEDKNKQINSKGKMCAFRF